MTIHISHICIYHTVLLIIIIVMALSAFEVPMSSIVATIGAAGLAIVLLFKTVFQTSQAALSYFFQSLLNAVIM